MFVRAPPALAESKLLILQNVKLLCDDIDNVYADYKTRLFSGSSIKCHQCNSYDSFHCQDPFYYEDSPDKPKTMEFLQDCPADTADRTYFCRKIYQNGVYQSV